MKYQVWRKHSEDQNDSLVQEYASRTAAREHIEQEVSDLLTSWNRIQPTASLATWREQRPRRWITDWQVNFTQPTRWSIRYWIAEVK